MAADTGPSSVLKPRFKGIENFLRRIAFNIGNTPSQTEVKIISCIPIDVTDLQNKIVDLERELDAVKGCSTPLEDAALCRRGKAHAAIGVPVFTPSPLFNANLNANTSQTPSLNLESPSRVSLSEIVFAHLRSPKPLIEEALEEGQNPITISIKENEDTKTKITKKLKTKKGKNKRGKTQMVYFSQAMYPKKICEEAINQNKQRGAKQAKEGGLSDTYLKDVVQRQYRPDIIDAVEPSTSSRFSWPVCHDEPPSTSDTLHLDSDVCSCCHGLFHNVDTVRDKDSTQRHDYSVYYDSSLYDVVPVRDGSSGLMMDKNIYQKRQNEVFMKLEDDYFIKSTQPQVQFHLPNVTKYCMVTPYRACPMVRCKKKLPNKTALKREQVIRAMQNREFEHNMLGKEPSYSGFVECGHVYTKPFNSTPQVVMPQKAPLVPPPSPPRSPPPILKNAECLTTNLEVQSSTNRSVQLEPPAPPEDNKTEVTLNQIKSILHAVLTEVKTSAQIKNVKENRSTKDAVVQNGPSPTNIATDSSYMNGYLYSPHCSFGPHWPKFSEQMAGSQAFYQTGSVIGSQRVFGVEMETASPFGPPGPSPCADSAKCVQNYPVFIHTPGRQCACCYRSVPQQTKPIINSVLLQNNTNTEPNKKPSHSKETNNLIKEIYKSLALNTNYPDKNISSNCTHSTVNGSKKFELKMLPKAKPKAVASEIITTGDKQSVFLKKKDLFGSTAASYRSEVKTTTTSRVDTESATARGDGVRSLLLSTSSDTPVERESKYETERKRTFKHTSDNGYRPEIHDKDYSDKRGRSPVNDRKRQYLPPKGRVKYTVPALPSSDSDEDTATVSLEDTESSQSTVVEKQKREKHGLFSKMKKLFTGRTRRRRKKEESETSLENELERTSDSDDYETIYSEQTTRSRRSAKKRPATPPPAPQRRLQSKASFSRYNSREPATVRSPRPSGHHRREATKPPPSRRSPYLEQEYRRRWTEDLSFRPDAAPRYSSERPARSAARKSNYYRHSPPAHCSLRPPYWQQYEARPTFVPRPQHLLRFRPQPTLRSSYAPQYSRFAHQYSPYAPQYCPYRPPLGKVNGFGQTEPAILRAAKPQGLKPSLAAHKPEATGLAWFKKLNDGLPQCGVRWKKFFLDG